MYNSEISLKLVKLYSNRCYNGAAQVRCTMLACGTSLYSVSAKCAAQTDRGIVVISLTQRMNLSFPWQNDCSSF